MKKSNKLIIALLTIVFMAVIGTNMVLKAEYEKIDQKDVFYGYTTEKISHFKTLRLSGGANQLIQLQPGKDFEVRVVEKDKNKVKWHLQGDTLLLSYGSQEVDFRYRQGSAFSQRPALYIIAPNLSAVYANGVTCKFTGWQQADWTLQQAGTKSGMLLIGNTINHLAADARRGGLLQIDSQNQIGQATFQVKDSSSLVVEKSLFGSIQIQIDSVASVKVPGSLLKKLTQN